MQVIGGKFRGRKLKAPKGTQTRPTSGMLRETFFNIVQFEIEGAIFLDIFAGSGAMGIEALSRGAEKVCFIESSRVALAALQDNLEQMKAKGEATILFGDYLKMLQRLKKQGLQFDLIFADAPYHMEDVVSILLSELEPLLKPDGKFFMENDKPAPASQAPLVLIDSRKSGKTYLHQYMRKP